MDAAGKGGIRDPGVCHDNGLPAKETAQKSPLKSPILHHPRNLIRGRPAFDAAKFTFVTGIVEVNDRPQVWLTDRTAGDVDQAV